MRVKICSFRGSRLALIFFQLIRFKSGRYLIDLFGVEWFGYVSGVFCICGHFRKFYFFIRFTTSESPAVIEKAHASDEEFNLEFQPTEAF